MYGDAHSAKGVQVADEAILKQTKLTAKGLKVLNVLLKNIYKIITVCNVQYLSASTV